MGYSTDFYGSFDLDKPLTKSQIDYLQEFSHTRRVQRKASKTEKLPDPLRLAVGLPIGVQGGYYVGSDADSHDYFDDSESDIVEINNPPEGQPGLWCQWVPRDDGLEIIWDGGEKFYNYIEWIEYLIENFLKPWGYVVNGKVSFQGEEHGDRGTIHVKKNVVKVVHAKIQEEEPDWGPEESEEEVDPLDAIADGVMGEDT